MHTPGRPKRSQTRQTPPLPALAILPGLALTVCVFAAPIFSPAQDASQSSSASDHPAASAPDSKKTEPGRSTAARPVDPVQAQLIADTQRLLKLSEELKAELAKTNKDTLSVTVVRKAEEVEKLAKSIKDRVNKTPKS